MDCSPPGFSVHGISQARILQWVAISFSGDRTHISWTGRWVLYHWDTRLAKTVSGFTEKLIFLSLSRIQIVNWQKILTLIEKEMATHCSILAWKIPWTEEPGGLQSMGSQRVRHDWATSLSLFTFMHWRRNWQPTPVFLPGESRGRRSLVGCCLWGRPESDTTEVT